MSPRIPNIVTSTWGKLFQVLNSVCVSGEIRKSGRWINAGKMLAYIKEKAICSLHFMFCLPSSLFFSELVYFIGLLFFFWQRDKSRSNWENLSILQSSQRILVCYQTSRRYRASMGLGTFWLVKVTSELFNTKQSVIWLQTSYLMSAQGKLWSKFLS